MYFGVASDEAILVLDDEVVARLAGSLEISCIQVSIIDTFVYHCEDFFALGWTVDAYCGGEVRIVVLIENPLSAEGTAEGELSSREVAFQFWWVSSWGGCIDPESRFESVLVSCVREKADIVYESGGAGGANVLSEKGHCDGCEDSQDYDCNHEFD